MPSRMRVRYAHPISDIQKRNLAAFDKHRLNDLLDEADRK
jgi:hypothetical protein